VQWRPSEGGQHRQLKVAPSLGRPRPSGCALGPRSCARSVGLHVSCCRVQNGYVSSGTSGLARPTLELKNCPVSSENVPVGGREWTPVPHSSFPRNEGVPGSSPGVGFLPVCRSLFCVGNGRMRPSGTKRVRLLTGSRLVKVSHLQGGFISTFAGASRLPWDSCGLAALPESTRAVAAFLRVEMLYI
jgi:hypothetical protein